jgi:nicotinamide-nucleotide amidase
MIKKILDYLITNNKTISFAESCTGGNLSVSITKIPGASKENIIGIKKNEIDIFSPVSQEIAIKMAEKVKVKFNSNYSIAVTGNAGPSTDGPESIVGDYFIAISSKSQIFCEKYNFVSSREDFIKTVTDNSFKLFIDKIINR